MKNQPLSRSEVAAQELRQATQEAHQALKDLRQATRVAAEVTATLRTAVDSMVEANLRTVYDHVLTHMDAKLDEQMSKRLDDYIHKESEQVINILVTKSMPAIWNELPRMVREEVADQLAAAIERARRMPL